MLQSLREQAKTIQPVVERDGSKKWKGGVTLRLGNNFVVDFSTYRGTRGYRNIVTVSKFEGHFVTHRVHHDYAYVEAAHIKMGTQLQVRKEVMAWMNYMVHDMKLQQQIEAHYTGDRAEEFDILPEM